MKKFKTSLPCKPEQLVSDANRSCCHCLPFMSQNVIRKMSQLSSEHITAPEIKQGFRNLSVCLRRGSCQSGWTQGEDVDTVKQSKQAPWLSNSRDGRTGGVQRRLGAQLCPGKPCLAWHWTGLNPAGPESSPEPWLCCWLCSRQAPGTLLGDALPVVHSPSPAWFPCKAL